MARQAAHEIKKVPLTPMKLDYSTCKKAINNNQSNVKQLAVANTLVEQIDHSSKIAADFPFCHNIGNQPGAFRLARGSGPCGSLFLRNQSPYHPVLEILTRRAVRCWKGTRRYGGYS